MKRYLYAIILMAIPLIAVSQSRHIMTRSEYIDLYKETAIRQMKESGIPASITLAQGIIESGDGNSSLAVSANNHFGIKCHQWSGKKYYQDDDRENECFRKYNDAEESYQDHSDFLRYNVRYASLFELPVNDYKGWAYGLQKAGYATNQHYAELLISIIEENRLYDFDRTAMSGNFPTFPPSPSELKSPVKANVTRESPHYQVSLTREIFTQNGVRFIIAQENDTFDKLAGEFNLFKKELLSFNDLSMDMQIKTGTRIYIERKKKSAPKHLDKHIIEGNETLYDISQLYGIRLKSLKKYNKIIINSTISEGTIINLRRK